MSHTVFKVTALSALVCFSLPLHAQELDQTETLPNARPGECYAKVVTPAKFEERSEDIIVQDATSRLTIQQARFETVEQNVLVSESTEQYSVVPVEYEEVTERVEIRPAENNWEQQVGKNTLPASPGALEGISQSGFNLDTVEPGTCFREFYTPAEYRTDTQRIVKREGSETIKVTEARTETVEERIVVQEASTRLVEVPAVYRTETESVLVEPARSVWKEGRGPIERIDDATGEIMCLVEIPARYETVTKTVLETPATSRTVDVPAVYETIKVQRVVEPPTQTRQTLDPEYATVTTRTKVSEAGFFWLKSGETANDAAKASGREVCLNRRDPEYTTVRRQVVKTPADVKVVTVPAQYQTVKVQRLLEPANESRTDVPSRTKTVTRQVQVAPSKLVWRKVLCETNMTRDIITSLQQALKREGFDPGPIDGVLGKGTMDAVAEYQAKHSLDRGGLTYETLEKLKVQL